MIEVTDNSYISTYLSHGMMLTRSKTMPVPSALRAQTGCVKGWKDRAQQSNGVAAPGCGASAFLHQEVVSTETEAGKPSVDALDEARGRRGVLAKHAGVLRMRDIELV